MIKALFKVSGNSFLYELPPYTLKATGSANLKKSFYKNPQRNRPNQVFSPLVQQLPIESLLSKFIFQVLLYHDHIRLVYPICLESFGFQLPLLLGTYTAIYKNLRILG